MADRKRDDAAGKKAPKRQDRPARARKDPDWNRKDQLDLRRARKVGEDEPKDAEGQAERGHIDQIITGKGYAQTR